MQYNFIRYYVLIILYLLPENDDHNMKLIFIIPDTAEAERIIQRLLKEAKATKIDFWKKGLEVYDNGVKLLKKIRYLSL